MRPQARFCPKCGRPHPVAASSAAGSAARPGPATPRAAEPVPEPTRAGHVPGGYPTRPEPPTAVSTGSRRWPIGWIVAVVLLVVVVSGGSSATAWFMIHRADDSDAGADTVQAAGSSSGVRPAPAPSQPVDAGAALASRADSDGAAAQNLVGWWVPQLSSKAVGMEADGIRYDEPAILDNVRTLQGRFPGAVLVRSSDYSSFKRGGLWVVLANQPYDNAAAANAWCVAQGIVRDDCFAKRLSTTDGPAGNTVQR